MKTYLAFLILSLVCLNVHAQADSSLYQAQRLKINSLLTERSAKFGQYDESLKQRSGIFGLQTKKDIRNSNDILRQVVLHDNEIFTQLKLLMEYKDVQNQQVLSETNSSSERLSNYMQTIKKLQDKNSLVKKELEQKNKYNTILISILLFLVLLILGSFYFISKKFRKQRI